MAALEPGTILGDYEIVRELGQGGMGKVYLARDAALDRPVAIKTIVPAYGHDPELIQRFQQEARAAARMTHRNIVQIHKVDIESDPPYMAMEYVDGKTLDEKILAEGPMKWQRALTVCAQVVSALALAHSRGIIHRDIKLGNIMMNQAGIVKVTDFGLAKVMDSSLKLTRDSRAIGSPCYMSPEQCGIGEVGPASDLFSLGIAMFEMIAGRLPFEADTALEMMRKITSEPIPPLREFRPETPEIVQRFVEHLAERRLAHRYQTANQVLEDLKVFRESKSMPYLQKLMERSGDAPIPGPGEHAATGAANATPAPDAPVAGSALKALAELPETFAVTRVQRGRGYAPEKPRPLRRAMPVVSVLAALALAWAIVAIVATRGAGTPTDDGPPPPPAQIQQQGGTVPGPAEAAQQRPLDRQFVPQPQSPGADPSGIQYPRGFHPAAQPPPNAPNNHHEIWNQVYGPGGLFPGAQSLTQTELEELRSWLSENGVGETTFAPPPRRR